MKKLLPLLISAPLWGGSFQKFGSLSLGAQASGGLVGAGIGYLFLQSSLTHESGSSELSLGQTFAGLSVGYTLGILFSGKIFQGKGNPFLTLIANCVPFFGPLFVYHISSGSKGFSESLALFNLSGGELSYGLPIPYRKTGIYPLSNEALYYVNLATIEF